MFSKTLLFVVLLGLLLATLASAGSTAELVRAGRKLLSAPAPAPSYITLVGCRGNPL